MNSLCIYFRVLFRLNLSRRLPAIIFISLCYVGGTVLSQDIKLPQIIPPSPDATSIAKFGDIPVSTYTGVPNISVPLFIATSRDISVPLSLSYHASGIRVEEEASWIGLGWALSTGGMISRSVRGNDDFSQQTVRPGYVYSQAMPNEQQIPGTNPPEYSLPYNYVLQASTGATDPQPDVFSYNFMGYSGKFCLKKKTGTNAIEVVVLTNNEKISIKYNESTSEWTILTKEGIRAVFKTKEYSNTLSGPISNPAFMPNPLTWEGFPDIVTSWYLNEISSPAGGSFTFEYDVPAGQPKPLYASRSIISVSESSSRLAAFNTQTGQPDCAIDRMVLGRRVRVSCLTGANPATQEHSPCAIKAPSFSGSMTITWNIYLKRITYNNGEIKFITSQRSDIEEHSLGNGSPPYAKPRKLDAIEIFENGRYLRTFSFKQSYYNANPSVDYLNKRLKLDEVVEKNGTVTKQPFVFSYFGDNSTGVTFLPPKNSKARDHWGLYNGKIDNVSLVPRFSYIGSDGMSYSAPGADRDADEESSKQGILEKIAYPTGGYTKLFFEAHKITAKETVDLPFEEEYFEFTNPTNPTKVFELNQTTGIAITANLKCATLACYPTGSGQGTPCNTSGVFGNPYIIIRNLSTGAEVYKKFYGDYGCKEQGSLCDFSLTQTLCGVTRREEITLGPGRYIITSLSGSGFLADASISYKMRHVANSQSGNVQYVGGGLRVKKTIDHDGFNTDNDIVRTYDYTTKNANGEVLSTGKLMTIPKYHSLETSSFDVGGNLAECAKIKSVSYSNVPLGSSAQGSPVGYDKVIVRYGENGENGYSVFQYKNDPDIETEPFLPNSPTIDHDASNGLLTSEAHYTRDRFKIREVVYDHILDSGPAPSLRAIMTYSTPGVVGYKKYEENSEWWKLNWKNEKVYDVTDASNTRFQEMKTTFIYGNEHKMVTQTQVLTSKGSTLTTNNYYPLDVQDPASQEMWNSSYPGYKHMHSQLLRQETFETKDNVTKFISGIKNKYVSNAEHDVNQTRIETAKTDGVYESRISFEKYDLSNNLLQVRKAQDIPISYLYGYENSSLPVAQAVNATWDQIYYQGFEDVPSATSNPDLAHAGRKYKTTSYAIPFQQPEGQFTLSFWKYANSKWSQVVQNYAGPITISGERLDDIRIYPVAAQMTTYNYDPLTGLITSTDANNQSAHFEYDELQRLIKIRDQQDQLVTGYKYKN